MTTEERDLVHPLRIEGRVNYYDPLWGNLWFEHEGQCRYVRLSRNPPMMRNGQRVRIEGTYIPGEGLAADRATVSVLAEFEPVAVLETKGRISDVQSFDRRVVLTEGYVDEQQLIDDAHLRLTLIIEDRRVICWVPPNPKGSPPDWQGCFLRVKAVYSGRRDPTGTEATVELWVARQEDVEVLGTIAGDPDFGAPLVGAGSVSSLPPGSTVRLRGRIRQRALGANFVLRDDSGEVLVHSLQNERVPAGVEIDVVGRTAVAGSRWVLESALFRRRIGALADQAERPTIDRIERIRQLAPEAAGEGRDVAIGGVVTWALPDADYFFIQDLSGGVRVQLPPGMQAPRLQKSGTVVGSTARGKFGPVVNLHQFHDSGSMAHPSPKRITYAQAITGAEDGQWVEMRGFIRRTASEGDWHWIYVTTPDGEFVGHLLSPVGFVATPGSLLRVRGVCEVTTDAKNRASGVRLRVPFLHDILIEEDAPAEMFDLPLHRIADLRRVFSTEDPARARVAAQVVHHVPGQYIVVQDGSQGFVVYSRATDPLTPGDRIEAVGIVGHDGARMVLRDAVFRRIEAAEAPEAAALTDTSLQDPRNDLRLVRVKGRLLDYSQHAGRVHFTLLSGGAVFDATLDHPVGAPATADYDPGVMLELTGIYRLEFDDLDRPHGFSIQLRSESGVVVLEPARFWTVGRALGTAAALCACLLVFFGWLIALRHRVRVQTGQIRSQLEKQASLEAELERAQRFRSLGLLAGGLAHDFNNLLTGILGNVTLAMLDERVMAAAGDSLRDIEGSATRARDLTQQLVTFAKGGDPVREALDFAGLLHNAVGFALSGAKARASFELATGLWPVHADRNQLGRALQNLIVHARRAMPDGGTIRIAAENGDIDAPTGVLQPGRYVRLAIIDSGPGLPPERLSGFFDPYSATKFGDDRFSLAIAYSIVRRHGGNLEVESVPGVGTTFRLWIPAADAPPVVVEPQSQPETTPVSIAGTRVLLMDDEQTIRRLGERMLTRLGCEICTTPDGESCLEAYRRAAAAGRRYQIVILDLTVAGGMGGAECIAELLKLDPDTRAIVSSGYSNDPVTANFRQHGFRAVVPKPYAVGALAEAIARVLREPR